jgi:hypothetical protein
MGILQWIAVAASPILVGIIAWFAKEWIKNVSTSVKAIEDCQAKQVDKLHTVHTNVVDIKAKTNEELLKLHKIALDLQTKAMKLEEMNTTMHATMNKEFGKIVIIEKHYEEADKNIKILVKVIKSFQIDLEALKKR